MTDSEYQQKQLQIKELRRKINVIEKEIDNSKYDEPVQCLSCDWKGRESELVEVRESYEYYPDTYLADVCPKCKSITEII